MNADFAPDWPNVDLGHVENRSFGKRLIKLVGGLRRILSAPNGVRKCDVIIARNFDLLLIAWAARRVLRRRKTPLVYECLDIHGLFTRSDTVGAVMRWCERRLLASTQLLIVSSPGFVSHYFDAVQGYRGPVSIIENKLWFDGAPAPRPSSASSKADGEPLTLGWVGSIRCKPSLDILMRAADQMGPDVQIAIHGNVHHHALPGFDQAVAERDNVTYHGAYSYPDDLARIYASCDLVWAQDLWQRGANSDWLLPNRIYEASWFGCPSIAVADTETGRRVKADGLGIAIPAPSADDLVQALRMLSRQDIEALSAAILAKPDEDFRLRPEDIDAALRPVLPRP
ncbi:glycosyltransferase [Aliiroseovarius sp. YM-037]|uniref:glycosyltransferase n=1 Tax=Aliiroseovarius sp. YM-037 TaxID=3341728 RepID=UPI003A807ABC